MAVIIPEMKATILLFSWILLISLGCGYDCDPLPIESSYVEGKEIEVTYDSINQRNIYDTLNGPFLLFQYHYHSPKCEGGADGGSIENLYFAIPDSLTEFHLVDSAIFKTNCYFQQKAAFYGNTQAVEKGVIEGNEIGFNNWRIKINIVIKEYALYPTVTERNIKFEGVFIK